MKISIQFFLVALVVGATITKLFITMKKIISVIAIGVIAITSCTVRKHNLLLKLHLEKFHYLNSVKH